MRKIITAGVIICVCIELRAECWTTKASMLTARSGLAIGVVNNKVYAIGGYNGSYLPTNEEYDPATNSWTTKASMLTARSGLAIGVVNNRVYAIGGTSGSNYLPMNEEYTPSFIVVSPNGGEVWSVGAVRDISFDCGFADIYLSIDGGYSWMNIAKRAASPYPIRVPHTPTRYALIKVVENGKDPNNPAYFDVSDSFFTIQSTITLLTFSAEPSREGIKLTWETEPKIPDIEGYNLYVSDNPDGPFNKLNSGIIKENHYVDKSSHSTFLIYRLGAVNGWGKEYIIGETAIMPMNKPLIVYPNTINKGGWLMFELYGPSYMEKISVEISIYDISGKKVKDIIKHSLTPGFYKMYLGCNEFASGKYIVLMRTPEYTKKAGFTVLK